MRLTLRTMLAYLDDVLEPADAEELGKKIDESEFANNLKHRIRLATRKLRLGAPKLEGKGIGLDASTVAEYLDSTLASERVPDFEKVCLESDVHLAEVASCHQILTLVLGEPADIPAGLRDRICRIGHASQPAPAESSASTAVEPPLSEKPADEKQTPAMADATAKEDREEKVARAKPEVPDYLKAGTERRKMPLVVVALLVLLVLSVGYFAVGPDRITAWLGGGNNVEDDGGSDPETSPDDDVDPVTKDKDIANVTPAPVEPVDSGKKDGTNDDNPPGPTPELPEDPKVEPAPMPMPSADDPPEPDPIPGVIEPEPKDAPAPEVKPVADPPKEVEVPRIDVGRFTSENQILARFDETEDTWYRLATNTTLASGDRLLALPTNRPQVVFSSGIQATIAGPAEMRINTPLADDSPQIEVERGRALMFTIGKPGTRVGLQLANRSGLAVFANADSQLAIEVARYLPPGADPLTVAALPVVHLLAVKGRIDWQQEGTVTPLMEGQVLVYLGDQEPRLGNLTAMPAWVTSADLEEIEKIALEPVEAAIDSERPMMLALEELAEHKLKVEVRMLATRCLIQLGSYDRLLPMLNDPDSKSFWQSHIDAARDALTRGPEEAAELLRALERERGADAEHLFRLLWGYSPQQLADGGAARLVEFLAHESLDYRVLAYDNLKRITGLTYSYSPHLREQYRAGPLSRWRSELDEGRIVYKTPPTPPTILDLSTLPAASDALDAKPTGEAIDLPKR